MAYVRLSQVAALGVVMLFATPGCTDRGSSGASGSETGTSTTSASTGGTGASSTGTSATGADTATDPAHQVKIAFVRLPDGESPHIYLMNLDGTGLTQLTFSAESGERYPAWSPDGSMLAFARWAGVSVEDITVLDLVSGEETVLTMEESSYWSLAWSPDSSRIALGTMRNLREDIYVIATDGTGETNLTDNPAADNAPSWPVGGRIFFMTDRGDMGYEIYSMDEDGGGPTALTNHPADDMYPVASPDGSRVAFERHDGGLRDLFVMNADGTDEVGITPGVDAAVYYAARWSPDGRYIAFVSYSAGYVFTIHRADADGSNMIDLTDGHSSNENPTPSWTPDSEQIVFVSDRDDANGEIYIMDLDGSNPTRLTNDPAADQDPVVRPVP